MFKSVYEFTSETQIPTDLESTLVCKAIFRILRLLDDGEFHSGALLAKQLQCSRAKISKALKHADILGTDLTKLCGRGYRWENPVLWLDANSIFRNPSINSRFFDLKIFDFIDSTNSFLLNDLEKKRSNIDRISVVIAELQTNGRGRLGRSWYSGLGDSLTFSLRWRFEHGMSALSGLSLVIGVAIIRVLKSFSIINVSLKWPNDILFYHHKLAGVLIELRGEILGPSYAVIGIGINFRLSEIIKSSIEQRVIDLFTITGKRIDRNLILGALLSELRNILTDFEKQGFTYFREEWIIYHAYEGKTVYITLPNNSVIEGIVDGVSDDGALCLITNTGRKFYNAGDISVRIK